MTAIVVIGAGLAGASAAWRLAQAGHEVTVLERTAPANRWGSSAGSARVFRYAYAERRWVDLVVAAERGWRELEAAHGSPLLTRVGSIEHGGDPRALARVLQAAGVPHDVLPAAESAVRFGIPADGEVLWQPTAGVLDAERTVHAMLRSAVSLGARLERDRTVLRVDRHGTAYRVHDRDGSVVDAEQVVVAAGGWLPDLLDHLSLPAAFLAALPRLEVRQEQVHHFPYRDARADPPSLIHRLPGAAFYGLPGGRDAGDRGYKVAEFAAGRVIRSAAAHDGALDDANRSRVTDHVARHLPGLVPEPYAESTCLFTSTPTEDFVIDRVDGVTVLSPCSGHGAKFAPLLGELVLDLVEGGAAVPREFRPSLAA